MTWRKGDLSITLGRRITLDTVIKWGAGDVLVPSVFRNTLNTFNAYADHRRYRSTHSRHLLPPGWHNRPIASDADQHPRSALSKKARILRMTPPGRWGTGRV